MNSALRVFLRENQVCRGKAIIQPISRKRINSCYKTVTSHQLATHPHSDGEVLICKKERS
jgi:hypothetical protein